MSRDVCLYETDFPFKSQTLASEKASSLNVVGLSPFDTTNLSIDFSTPPIIADHTEDNDCSTSSPTDTEVLALDTCIPNEITPSVDTTSIELASPTTSVDPPLRRSTRPHLPFEYF